MWSQPTTSTELLAGGVEEPCDSAPFGCQPPSSILRGRGGPLGANLGALPPRCPQTGRYFE
jgi:hypothetical protein